MNKNWKTGDQWGIKEFTLLLLLEFVGVIGCVKFGLKPLYEQWFQNELYAGTLIGLTIAVVLTLGVYFIALRPKSLSWREVGVTSFAKKDWKMIALFSIMVMISAVILVSVMSYIGGTWENSKTESLKRDVTFWTVFLGFVSAAIISPIYEELFYRGFLYRWIRTRMGVTVGLLISALIFTMAHIPAYSVMPVNFVSGILFALAYERTNSIWPSIIIHGSTNGIMVLLASLS
ncbi:CPBP family intramembrane glutamic endopeptidase [Priestia koreensis]|uniref:CPBP family intramembrane glutamic endopeptidase n=1 Tax=Priestia koreensis TaxID=284581 RepID=UPI001F59AF14|nr:CPBP family intramembrane glutamic endopeptidase [Priestia koreensis]UNL83160.1 CPBP family intramembrane metalloprotease [Priestia koreensis]